MGLFLPKFLVKKIRNSNSVHNPLKKRGRGLHAFVFVIFVIPKFFAKQNMLNNQVER